MSRYIDAKKLAKIYMAKNKDKLRLATVINELELAPTADVVEVVRCKDCKYRGTRDCKMWDQCVICGHYHMWERDDYYCSYGERREG